MTTATRSNSRDVDRRGWHFEKRLSLDTLLAVIGMGILVGGPILVWGRAMEGRVLRVETISEQQEKLYAARQLSAERDQVSLTSRLDRLEGKVTEVQIAVGQLAGFASQQRKP